MLNLIISCTRFKRNYSGCTCRSSENLCSSSGGKKKIEGETQESINCLSFTPRLNVDVLLCGYVYESHPMYDQTLRVLVLSFHYFMDISVCFWRIFATWRQEKKGCRIQQRDFLEFLKRIRHILRKKKLEVVRFRQCVFSRSPEPGRIPKKSSSPPGQSPFIANQCWGSSPVHLLEEFEKKQTLISSII